MLTDSENTLMKFSGSADLPLHNGTVPKWLADRMAKLGLAITESIVGYYGKEEWLRRMADPCWFQCLGAVMGMDWHSSGITTSVLGALKRAINPHSKSLGIYICGGKGKASTNTPGELLKVGDVTGLNANELVRQSKLTAKVDNTAIQDGFQLYLHHFIVTEQGQWAVIQQGMHNTNGTARRYHWHSEQIRSFTEAPHTAICGANQGIILNLTDPQASPIKNDIIKLTAASPEQTLLTFRKLVLPHHHHITNADVNLKRLGAALWTAYDQPPADFEALLLQEGVGPRTLQSLTLVSEVIHGHPSRFEDPARFAFAHGGKDGHPFPVPLKVYDLTIETLTQAIDKSKLGLTEKMDAIKRLHHTAQKAEEDFTPTKNVEELIEVERASSWKYNGKTVFGNAVKPHQPTQLALF